MQRDRGYNIQLSCAETYAVVIGHYLGSCHSLSHVLSVSCNHPMYMVICLLSSVVELHLIGTNI